MNPDSIPGVLPLAEALRAWSDVELVAAVDVAETPFTTEQCDRFQREWLAEIVQHRFQPTGKRREPFAPQFQALETAWYRLFVHFGAKAVVGEIMLFGRMEKPIARSAAEPLPALWADELLYYPRRNTVIFREDVYRDVFAAPRSSARVLQERLQEARSAAGSIPLASALRNWADPTLLSEVCRCERTNTQHEMAGYLARPMLSDPQDLAKPSSQRWTLGHPDFVRLSNAWGALEDDLRDRLVRGEFHLKGVMAKPRREVQFEVLPGVWAADFAFDFHRNTVGFDDARYVAVTASYGAGALQAQSPGDPGRVLNGAPSDRAIEPAPAEPRQHLGGRKNTRAVVEEALRVHWDELFPKGAPRDPSPWTGLTGRLIKLVARSGDQRRIGFPKEETVRKHLPDIYARMLVEKGEIAPNDQ